MIEDSEFHVEMRQMVMRRAETSNLVDTMAFISEVAERLEEDPVFGEFIQVEYLGVGSGKGKPNLKLHGYTEFDDSDGTLGLVVGRWSDTDSPDTLSSATV